MKYFTNIDFGHLPIRFLEFTDNDSEILLIMPLSVKYFLLKLTVLVKMNLLIGKIHYQ